MKIHFIIIILLAVAYGQVLTMTQNFNPSNFETQELKYVGLADGVAYFHDITTTLSWYDARRYCQSANLTLAVINTENQMQLLRSATQSVLPDQLYWSSGRDAHNIRQFSWDYTATAVPEFVGDDGVRNWVGVGNYQTCLGLHKQGNKITAGLFEWTAWMSPLCST